MGVQPVWIPILQSGLRSYWAYAKRNNAACDKDARAGIRQARMPQREQPLRCNDGSLDMSKFNASSTFEVGENTPETVLWRAVIARTIQEWISGPLRRQREAEQYLFDDNRDFPLVCKSAGMDSGQLRSRLARLRGHAIPDYLLPAA